MKKFKQQVSILLTALMVMQPAQNLVTSFAEVPVVTTSSIVKGSRQSGSDINTGSNASPSDAVTALAFDNSALEVEPGTSQAFTGKITIASDSDEVWSSASQQDKEALFTFDTEGLLDNEALNVTDTTFKISGKVADDAAGTYTVSIFLTGGEPSAKMKVTVPEEILLGSVMLSFQESSLSVEAGKNVTNVLTAVVKNDDTLTEAAVLENVVYKSKNETVAAVTGDQEGNVTVTGKAEGIAVIEATYQYGDAAVAAEFEVEVTKAEETTPEPEEKTLVLNPANTAVLLDVNEAAEENQKSYTFTVETNYDMHEVFAEDENQNIVEIDLADPAYDNIWTITPLNTGVANVIVFADDADGSTAKKVITVTVQDSSDDFDTVAGTPEIDTDNANVKEPERPKDIADELFNKLLELVRKIGDSVKAGIAANKAVEVIPSTGFDNIFNMEDIEELPKGVAVAVYPKQELTEVKTVLVETGVDEAGNPVYEPVITSIKYNIDVYAKAEGAENATKLEGVEGRFTFPIPVPNEVKQSWVNLKHYKADGKTVDSEQWCQIRNKDGHRYIEAKNIKHFSDFELIFADNRPGSGSSSSGSGNSGSGSSSTYTGRWIQDAKGWWYQYADKSYPAGRWAYLTYNNISKWYHFDAEGYMQTGWFTDTDGSRYYLHPVADGTRGYMYTGWNQIEGKWYYFTETKTEANPVGSLKVNTTTPDGYQVDANGIWVQ